MTSPTGRPYREFGSWLRSRRLARRWTQEELARRLDYGVTYVRKIEWGVRPPSDSFRVRLAQVLAVPVSSLPPSLPPAAASRLPEPPSLLVGRADELKAVLELFERGCRLVTLTGAPGIGKSRLGLAVAAQFDARLPGGAVFVPLAGVADTAGVIPAIGDAVGLVPPTGDDGVGRVGPLADRLRSQETLLVLDNFEHVVEAAPTVADLLARAPGLRALVTSRRALEIASEIQYFVPPLAVPEHLDDSLERLAEVDAVALFVARARNVRADFALEPGTGPAVGQICARLQGIPLAIELAASATRFLSAGALLEQLGGGLDLPVGGSRGELEHHRTLRAAIGWSFELLRPSEHLLMTRLAVFVDGCTVDAASAVCRLPSEETLDPRTRLLRLASQSLVEPRPDAAGGPRFVALEAVRAFAAERLEESGQRPLFQGRHAIWCVELAEATVPDLTGSGQAEALAVLDADHANLRAALAWSLEHDPPIGARLCAALWRFWWIRGHLAEGRKWLDTALARPHPDAARAQILAGNGVLARTQGAFGRAAELLKESAVLSQAIGDRRTRALSSINLGIVAEHQGHHEEAWRLFGEAQALYAELGDVRGIGHSQNCQGTVCLAQGDLEGSLARFEDALTQFREVGDDWSVAMVLSNLGWVANKQGRSAVARSLYEKALAKYRALGDDRGVAWMLVNLGTIGQGTVAGHERAGLFEESLLIFARLGERLGVAECLEALAAARSRAAPRSTAVLLGAAEILRHRIGAPLWPDAQAVRDAVAQCVRARLGDEAFDVAWHEGRILDEDEVVAAALIERERPFGPGP